ncbi:ras-related protein Rap-2a [Exaiptasia diaphana]|uniref:Uncharacterized protein n=1 Tax=Exaiptasia diaphana TaxID=2652724 RepID=A0A913X2H4_EXADI|nr:ras-related protein Rap-2a [Exaiptasia diaphana]KXJ15945.1 GTP-binding protein Di-Ras2 [Exaiptasia diaphana]
MKGKNTYEIVFFGAAGVGKTSIIRRYYLNHFTNVYDPTVEDCYERVLNIHGNVIVLNTTDTSGSYQFPAMREVAIQRANAFVMVYSLDDRYSFIEVKRLLDEVIAVKKADNIPVVLVGNKKDMEHKREMSSEEVVKDITDYIRVKNARQFNLRQMETSAKDNHHIDSIFCEIVDILTDSSCSKPEKTTKRVMRRLKSLACMCGSYSLRE